MKLRGHVAGMLKAKGIVADFTDADALFSSGGLDSLDAMGTVVFLEENFDVHFADIGFDQGMIDSVDALESLVRSFKK